MVSTPLRVTHVQGIFSPEHGGPCFSLANYCRGQVARGNQVSVRVLEGYPHTSPALRLPPPIDFEVCRVGFPSKLGGSAALRRVLARDTTPDIYHLHGAWLLAMKYGADEARRRGRPYVVELMGAYEAYPRRQKWLRKWIARKLFQDELLRRAACLHVCSLEEAKDLRDLGFRAPIMMLPVGVDTERIAQSGASDDVPAAFRDEIAQRPFVLYLSRIHPKKGIELLLRAWAEAGGQFPEHRLLIAGSGEPAYVDHCQQLAKTLGVQDRCRWLGQVSEDEKSWLYRHADVYVLPTYSENFGNSVAEALAHGTPVVTTPYTAWKHLPAARCGWLADTEVASVRDTLALALGTDHATRRQMGEAGRELVRRRYSLLSVVEQFDRVYAWLLGGSEPTDILAP